MKANSCVLFFYVAFGLAIVTLGQDHTLVRKEERPEILRVDRVVTFQPIWTTSGLLGLEQNHSSAPVVWTIDRTGRKQEFPFSVSGAGEIIVWSLAGAKDGSIILGGLAIGEKSQGAGFLAIVSRDRTHQVVIRTAPFIPKAITADSQGNIWSIGWDIDGDQRTYDVLRRFDASGKLLSRSKLQVKVDRREEASHGSILRASEDRVGWLTSSLEYLEFSLDGREIGRYAGPPWSVDDSLFATLAISGNNDVMARTLGRRPPSMWTLDRASHAWKSIEVEGEKLDVNAAIFGFDGNELVIGSNTSNRGYIIIRYGLSSPTLAQPAAR